MIGWIFGVITLSAVIVATFVSQMKHAILALWVAGLGIGAIYLTLGAEFLAIIQWIICTLVTISLIFFAVMFGEYNSTPAQSSKHKMVLLPILSIFLGLIFAGLIQIGASHVDYHAFTNLGKANDLSVIGQTLTHKNLLSLEVLGLTLFLVLVGGGVVSRSEGDSDS